MYKLAKAPHPKTYEGLTANTWELYDLEKDPTETTNSPTNNVGFRCVKGVYLA